jgi:hypothetical protein
MLAEAARTVGRDVVHSKTELHSALYTHVADAHFFDCHDRAALVQNPLNPRHIFRWHW